MVQQDNSYDPWSLDVLKAAQTSDNGPLLSIDTIKAVDPLDNQFGVYPSKTVPDILYEPLFGQPEPTAAEVAAAGDSPENVSPMRTYAILDAAKMPYILTGMLETSKLRYQSLFQGAAQEELKEAAPYLVELQVGNDFTRRLFTSSSGAIGLWDKDLGIYVRSRLGFDAIRKHFRKFTRLQDENENWLYWRFWEPGTLEYWLGQAAQSKVASFFSIPMHIMALRHDGGWSTYQMPVLKEYQKAVIVLDKSDRDIFRSYRLGRFYHGAKKWLTETYGPPAKLDNIDSFLKAEIQSAIDHYRTFDGNVLIQCVAASWLLGRRALGELEEIGDTPAEKAKSLHDQAYRYKFIEKA